MTRYVHIQIIIMQYYSICFRYAINLKTYSYVYLSLMQTLILVSIFVQIVRCYQRGQQLSASSIQVEDASVLESFSGRLSSSSLKNCLTFLVPSALDTKKPFRIDLASTTHISTHPVYATQVYDKTRGKRRRYCCPHVLTTSDLRDTMLNPASCSCYPEYAAVSLKQVDQDP